MKRLWVATIVALSVSGLFMSDTLCKQSILQPQRLWTREQTEIEAPSFSADGKEMLITIKAHEPDGHEAESFSEAQLRDIGVRKQSKPRWADPQICILKLADHAISTVDYGWRGAFSKNGDQIFYDHQVKPISGFRRLAEPLSGNDVRVYDRKTNKSQVLVAGPKTGYLGDPRVSPNGLRLAYSINDATNGDWGGTVGAGIVDLQRGSNTTVVAPAKKHDLYKLVGPIFWASNLLIARVDIPAEPGSYLAEHYATEIVSELGKCLYRLKAHDIEPDNISCCGTSDGKVRVCRGPKMGCAVVDPMTGLTTATLMSAPSKGTEAPNGTFTAYGDKGKLILKNLKTGSQRSFSCNGEVRAIVWSPDSTQMAFITDLGAAPDAYSDFVRDELWRIQM